MNKDELRKEAEEKAKKRTKGFACQENCEKSYVMGALDFAEPREKRIAELEKENAELTKDKNYFSDSLDKQIEATLKLQQENAKLDCQKNRNKFCYSCANATERCFKNEIGCPCEKYKSYKEELKQEAEEYDLIIRFKSIKPKYEIRDYIINHTLDEFDNLQMWDFKKSSEFAESREKRDEQLIKAKELIEDMYDQIPSSHSDYYKDVMERARQFISEVEK